MLRLVVTCIAGVESIVKNEAERLGYKILETKDRLVSIEGDDASIARMNLWSRVGSKVYLEITKKQIKDFDSLFDLIHSIDWKKYIPEPCPVIVDAVSLKSQLSSTPAIQKTVKKSIVTKLTGSRNDIFNEDPKNPPVEILVFMQEDECRILLNTSGQALHKRGYRYSEHEAPIKESLAAALVLLSGWKYKEPFYDFFCGSGTILIEAALIARNIAPGSLGRRFAFENFRWYPKEHLEKALIEAKEKSFSDKKYDLIGSDIEEEYVEMALKNCKNAGVDDTITITQKDIRFYTGKSDMTGTLVSNPPYGLRLDKSDTGDIYRSIATIFSRNKDLTGGIITSFEEFEMLINLNQWKKRKLYNGNEKCYFYKKMA